MSTTVKIGAPNARRVVVGRLERVRRGKRTAFETTVPTAATEPQTARAALALALAHGVQRAIDAGEFRDQAEAAQKLGTTRARITQLVDLTLLAADLQLHVLERDAADGAAAFSERELRKVSRAGSWAAQRVAWRAMRPISNL